MFCLRQRGELLPHRLADSPCNAKKMKAKLFHARVKPGEREGEDFEHLYQILRDTRDAPLRLTRFFLKKSD